MELLKKIWRSIMTLFKGIINKITLNNKEIVNLSQDTVEQEDVKNGKTFHNKNGQQLTGTLDYDGLVAEKERLVGEKANLETEKNSLIAEKEELEAQIVSLNTLLANSSTLASELSQDTVEPEDVKSGKTFHNKSGEQVEGTLDYDGLKDQINSLKYDKTVLLAAIADKNAEILNLNRQIDSKNAEIDELVIQIANKDVEIQNLNAQIANSGTLASELSQDTVEPEDVKSGKTFHYKDGRQLTGTLDYDALADEFLYFKQNIVTMWNGFSGQETTIEDARQDLDKLVELFGINYSDQSASSHSSSSEYEP